MVYELQEALKNAEQANDENKVETEIIILSDTVRQRRARTPNLSSEASESKENEPVSTVLPDLLPKTFRLAESSALFSRVSDGQPMSVDETVATTSGEVRNDVSKVEIKEKNLSPKMSVRNIEYPLNKIDQETKKIEPKVGEIVDTINILESCKAFEPEYVETVNIIDASSDTDTSCSSPKLDVRKDIEISENGNEEDDDSMDDLENELEKELAKYDSPPVDDKLLKVEKKRISYDEKHEHFNKKVGRDHDILKESEIIKPLPGAEMDPMAYGDTIMPERDSFYNSDKENYDEPLVFSDDEDIPRYSIEMATDSDSDTVFIA